MVENLQFGLTGPYGGNQDVARFQLNQLMNRRKIVPGLNYLDVAAQGNSV